MKVLLLIPHTLVPDRHVAVRAGERPQTDYDALAGAIRAIPGGEADILDRSAVVSAGGRLVRLAHRLLGIDWALALLGFLRCRRYDAVLTHSESLGLPLSLLLALLWRRPRHVTTAYYLVGKRNMLWYKVLRAHTRIDRIFVLNREQYEFGRHRLGLPAGRLVHMDSCGYVDTTFFAGLPALPVEPRQVCSTGREFRDYETLIKAAEGLDGITVKIDPASPWSAHQSDLASRSVPPNVEICRMPIGAVWRLYAESAAVVIPLHPNPIGAGSTVLVEAMAMGKPVIATRSRDRSFAGRPDLIDGENIILVDPHDAAGLRAAIARLVDDAELSRNIGANGRRWAEIHAGRPEWVNIFLGALGAPMEMVRPSGHTAGHLETVSHT